MSVMPLSLMDSKNGPVVMELEKVIGVIPARAGSKRLPRKNVLPLAGRPCIEWTLKAVSESTEISHVAVSTDDPTVQEIVSDYGGVELINRPDELGRDDTSTVDVVLHALDVLKARGYRFSWLLLLQPTSPLRTSNHIDEAIRLVQEKRGDGVVSICRTGHPREWAAPATPGESLEGFFSKTELERSGTEFPTSYTVNGAIYLIRTSVFEEQRTFFPSRNIIGYEMERRYSVDIDDLYDFELAEWTLSASRRNSL